MKLLFALIFALFLANVRAFWSSCSHTSAPGPDLITSPHCSGDRCEGVRGHYVQADIYATPRGVHHELRTRITAFILGIGIVLPVEPPYDDACNEMFHNGVHVPCPTVPNRQYMLRVVMPISEFYPPFRNTRVRVEFFDGTEIAGCGEVIADII